MLRHIDQVALGEDRSTEQGKQYDQQYFTVAYELVVSHDRINRYGSLVFSGSENYRDLRCE